MENYRFENVMQLGQGYRRGRFFPFLREFFVVFLNEDTAYILNKKTWNPNPPYKF